MRVSQGAESSTGGSYSSASSTRDRRQTGTDPLAVCDLNPFDSLACMLGLYPLVLQLDRRCSEHSGSLCVWDLGHQHRVPPVADPPRDERPKVVRTHIGTAWGLHHAGHTGMLGRDASDPSPAFGPST